MSEVDALIEKLIEILKKQGYEIFRFGNQYFKRIRISNHRIDEIFINVDGAMINLDTQWLDIYIDFKEHRGVDVVIHSSLNDKATVFFKRGELKLRTDNYGIVIGEYYSKPHIKLCIARMSN